MSSTRWQSFCIAATLTGGVYLPVGVITLHNSSLAQLGRAWPPNQNCYNWFPSYHITAVFCTCYNSTSTGIDADASKGETSPGYFNSKLVYSYRCGTIFPWEFPEISLAYSHIFMKGPSRSIIYGQIFWYPHPHPHIASPACIYHQNQLSFAFRFSFHLSIHFENAGNICNKIDL